MAVRPTGPQAPDAGMSGTFDPWRVSADSCELVLRRAFPHLTLESVVVLGEGWDSVAFLINNSLVFRLPKRPAVARMLERERALLHAISNLLPLPVPRYLHIADTIPGMPYGVGGYRVIAGVPLSTLAARNRIDDTIADSLAGFLVALHRIDTSQLAPGIVAPTTPDDWWSEHCQLFEDARPILRDLLHSGTYSSVEREWEQAFTVARQIGFVPLLVHRDLATEHLIIDHGGSLAGIIDFGDAGLGDPAIDLAGLPDVLAQRVLRAYTADARERAWLSARRHVYQLAVPLHAIQSGLELGRDELLEDGLRILEVRSRG
jgi:aminoglycoside 2''-phosphotransferase